MCLLMSPSAIFSCFLSSFSERTNKNYDIWVRKSDSVRFFTRQSSVQFGFLHIFLLSGSVRFLAKPGFWFGSFLLGSDSFPSLIFIVDKGEFYAIGSTGSDPDGSYSRSGIWFLIWITMLSEFSLFLSKICALPSAFLV